MKRLALGMMIAALAAPVAGCDDDGPTTPSNPPIVFTSQLSAANEVPPITNAESGGRGTATITFTLTRDSAQAITGGTARFEVSLNGFPANSVARLAHIHPGATGVIGNVLVDTGLTPASPVTLANGTGSFTLEREFTITPAQIQSIIDNPAGFYFNVHTPVNPGGAVRGQLQRQ
jgi:hypothetical protein